jgi:hypothetical protein
MRDGIRPAVLEQYDAYRLDNKIAHAIGEDPKRLEDMLKWCFVPLGYHRDKPESTEVRPWVEVGVCTDLYHGVDQAAQAGDTAMGIAGLEVDIPIILQRWTTEFQDYYRLIDDQYPLRLDLTSTFNRENVPQFPGITHISQNAFLFSLFYNWGIGDKNMFMKEITLLDDQAWSRGFLDLVLRAAIDRNANCRIS